MYESALVAIFVICVIAGLLLWILQRFPLPAPFGNIAYVAVVVLAVLAIVMKLVPLAHGIF